MCALNCIFVSVLVPKYYLWPKIQLHNVEDWNSRVIDTDLAFDWDPDILVYPHLNCEQSSSWCNYTDASDVMIDIQLIGYEETVDSDGEPTVSTFVSGRKINYIQKIQLLSYSTLFSYELLQFKSLLKITHSNFSLNTKSITDIALSLCADVMNDTATLAHSAYVRH